jgi:hypothetical protein
MAGKRAGDDRRVVRERDGRQARHRAVLEREAHVEHALDVWRFAAGDHVVEHVGVRAVEQEPDHVAGTLVRIEKVGQRLAVLHAQIGPVVARGAPEQRADRGRDVDEARCLRHHPELPNALAPEDERGAGLHDAQRTVLAEVPALVLPVVGGGVQHTEVRGGGRVEQLRDVLERKRVGVLGAVGVRVRALVGERRELGGRLVGERVFALDVDPLEAGFGPTESDPAVVGLSLVCAVGVAADHVDDRLERAVREEREGGFGFGPVCVGDLVRGLDLGHFGRLGPVSVRGLSFLVRPDEPSGPGSCSQASRTERCNESCARSRPSRATSHEAGT